MTTYRAPAPILNKQQFYGKYGTRFGAPGSGAYSRYVGYVKRHRAALTGQPGFTPSPTGYAPGGVRYKPIPAGQQVGAGGAPRAGGGGGGGGGGGKKGGGYNAPPGAGGKPPQTLMQQAQAMVNAALAPIIASTTKSYGAEQASRALAIKQATQEYERAVAQYGPAVAGAYQTAQGAQAGSDTALANLLQGRGTQAAGELTASLGAPAGSEAAAGLQAVGRGAAAAGYGMGSADLTKLIAQGTAAANYGAKLPGLAALTGLQDTARMVGEVGRQRADALSKIRAAGPGQALDLYNTMVGRRSAAAENAANRALQMKLAEMSGLVSLEKAKTSGANSVNALNERIRHDKATEANTSASTEQRAQASRDRLAAQKLLKAQQAAAKGKKTEAHRQTAYYSARKAAFAKAATWRSAAAGGGAASSAVVGAAGGGGSFHPRDYGEAYKRLFTLFAPQLINQYGFKPVAVRKMIAAAARSYMKPVYKPPPPSGPLNPLNPGG